MEGLVAEYSADMRGEDDEQLGHDRDDGRRAGHGAGDVDLPDQRW
jgi:hypothetical protein